MRPKTMGLRDWRIHAIVAAGLGAVAWGRDPDVAMLRRALDIGAGHEVLTEARRMFNRLNERRSA